MKMGGEENSMQIYGETKSGETIELSSAEILFNKKELDEYVSSLVKFKSEIEQYIEYNKLPDSAFTHMHYQDYVESWEKGDSDLVIYVNMKDY